MPKSGKHAVSRVLPGRGAMMNATLLMHARHVDRLQALLDEIAATTRDGEVALHESGELASMHIAEAVAALRDVLLPFGLA